MLKSVSQSGRTVSNGKGGGHTFFEPEPELLHGNHFELILCKIIISFYYFLNILDFCFRTCHLWIPDYSGSFLPVYRPSFQGIQSGRLPETVRFGGQVRVPFPQFRNCSEGLCPQQRWHDQHAAHVGRSHTTAQFDLQWERKLWAR